jgi:hypothetical protein
LLDAGALVSAHRRTVHLPLGSALMFACLKGRAAMSGAAGSPPQSNPVRIAFAYQPKL